MKRFIAQMPDGAMGYVIQLGIRHGSEQETVAPALFVEYLLVFLRWVFRFGSRGVAGCPH